MIVAEEGDVEAPHPCGESPDGAKVHDPSTPLTEVLSILVAVSGDAREIKVMREVALNRLQVATRVSNPLRPQRVRLGSEESGRTIGDGRAFLSSWDGSCRGNGWPISSLDRARRSAAEPGNHGR